MTNWTDPTPQWHPQLLRALWLLSAPHPSVTDESLCRRLQALAIFGLMNTTLGITVLLPLHTPSMRFAVVAIVITSGVLYLLVRSAWYRYAIWLVFAILLLSPLLFLSFGRIDTLFQLIVAYLLASLFVRSRFPWAWLYTLAAATVISLSMFVLPLQEIITPGTLAASAVHILATLFLVTMVHQRDVEQLQNLVTRMKHTSAEQGAIIENLPGIVYTITRDYRLTHVHGANSADMSRKIRGVLDQRLDEALPTFAWEVIKPHIDGVLRTGQAVTYETPMHLDADTTEWMESRLAPLWIDNQIVGIVTLLLDISGRKQAERAYAENSKLLQTVLDTIMVGVFIQQHERIVFHNQMAVSLTGLSSEELAGHSLVSLVAPELRELAENWSQGGDHITDLSQSEIPMQTRDGERLWVNLTISSIEYQGQPALLVAFVNATRNVRMQQAVLQRERHFRSLIENSSDIIVVLDGELVINYVSPAIERVLGYSQEDLIGSNALIDSADLYHPDEYGAILAKKHAIREQHQPTELSLRVLHALGHWVWLKVVVTNMLFEPGVEAIIVNAHDVTNIQDALRAEREQRALSEALLNTAAALNSTLQLGEVLPHILDNLNQIVPYEKANIALIEDNGSINFVSHRGYSQAHERSLLNGNFRIENSSLCRRMIYTGEPILIDDVSEYPEWLALAGEDTRSYLGAPITLDEDVIGFLSLESARIGAFTEDDSLRLRQFTNHASLAIRNARAYEQGRALAASKERQRIASDLHDAVSQTLFSASMISETLPLLYEHDPEEVRAGLDELARLTKGALAEMRALLMELRPETLLRSDLRTLLSYLLNSFRTRTDATLHAQLHTDAAYLAPEVRVNLYRIAQEALNNIIRHAQATEVWVSLLTDGTQTTMTIRDDGRGFTRNGFPSEHMGLGIMRERAQNHNILLSINTEVGTGTTITATFPTPGMLLEETDSYTDNTE